MTKRVRLGKAVEGRDEKGIKKTICSFLKILHPEGPPNDEEFDEYVSYAVECRRRVKEQMNKRKPDDEFEKIDLSYVSADGKEVVVSCPESVNAWATLEPERKSLKIGGQPVEEALPETAKATTKEPAAVVPAAEPISEPVVAESVEEPQEQHFTILYGDTGHSFESLIGPYLKGATEIIVEDPYIRLTHQVQNFVRFCEAIVKLSAVKKIRLVTSYENQEQLTEVQQKLEELVQSLLEMDIVLDVKLNPNMHDREIRIDNGWVIKIGRGLDFYQKPTNWFEIGVSDLSLRKCLETKVDIYQLQR